MSVCSFVCLFVCHKSKPLNSLKSSYCIIHPSSFIILHSFFITLHSSFLHFATFELFSLLSFKLENRCCFAWTSFYLIWKTIFLLFTSYLWKEASKGNTAKFIIFSAFFGKLPWPSCLSTIMPFCHHAFHPEIQDFKTASQASYNYL